jgi:hypothetical protein
MLVENMYKNTNEPQRSDMLVENMYKNTNEPQRGDMLIESKIFFRQTPAG